MLDWSVPQERGERLLQHQVRGQALAMSLAAQGTGRNNGDVGLRVVEHVVRRQNARGGAAVCAERGVALHLLVLLALQVLLLLVEQGLAGVLHHVLLRVHMHRQALRVQDVLGVGEHAQRQVARLLVLVLLLQLLVHLVLLLLLVVLLQVVLDLLVVLQLLLL